MIILDTCVIRGMKLDSGDAYLLRAIRETGSDRVAVPWMVLEERAAQLAIEYGKAHEKAAQALRQLQRTSPLGVPALNDPDPEAVREHWRDRLKELVEVLPTSEEALRQGMYREANSLPPAGLKKDIKTGARDVAIWLSAVEYARANPKEKVFFVSGNTSDFTDGSTTYPAPMDKDVEGLGDRFVHLTRLADLLKRIAPPVDVTPQQVERFLPAYAEHFRDAALARWGMPSYSAYADRAHTATMARWGAPAFSAAIPRFPALVQASGEVGEADCWLSPLKDLQVKALEVSDVQGYHLGDHEWCTATVQWQFVGLALVADTLSRVCCTWTTRIMMPLVEDGPSPRILEANRPEAPANGQDVEWPTSPPSTDANARILQHLLNNPKARSSIEETLMAFAKLMQNALPAPWATRQFIEAEREAKIRLDVEADLQAEEEGWDGDGGDDLWHNLED
ncbi:PIN domain-containing protein [Streptomyces sp. NPDC057543]|uniref:PIN domain-containing protein n=1 Tax=Streptomyces sp. NPDC057543 TaxID=3346163 RepID=UPI00369FF16A